MNKQTVTAEIPKILVVASGVENYAWNNSLRIPLQRKEKVIVESNQDQVFEGYLRVRHGGEAKAISVFHKRHFVTLTKKKLI